MFMPQNKNDWVPDDEYRLTKPVQHIARVTNGEMDHRNALWYGLHPIARCIATPVKLPIKRLSVLMVYGSKHSEYMACFLISQIVGLHDFRGGLYYTAPVYVLVHVFDVLYCFKA